MAPKNLEYLHKLPRTKKWKKNISNGQKALGDKHWSKKPEVREKFRLSHLGKKLTPFSEIHKQNMSKAKSGKNNPAWKGGVSSERRRIWVTVPYKNFRIEVFERDKWICQSCLKVGGTLEVHHIKSWKNFPNERLNVSNGITLCEDCHIIANRIQRKYEQP